MGNLRLTRKLRQTIVVGNGINAATIEIVRLTENNVMLKITAAEHVKILRGEIVDALPKLTAEEELAALVISTTRFFKPKSRHAT